MQLRSVELLSGPVLPLNYYKLIIEYDGTNYHGFQIQPTEKTIQGELNNALSILVKTDQVKSIGSGRTDAGVHAFNQVVRIEIPLEINPNNLVKAINTKLPPDIRVKEASACSENFHPIFSAKSKEYNYVFATKEINSVFGRNQMAHFDYEFDFQLMQKACKAFEGTYDFKNYQCTGTDIESTIRTITLCEVVKYDSAGHWTNSLGDYYVIRVVGNGFLKQMVRLMVGAIWNASRNKIQISDIHNSLLHPTDKRLGAVAPAQGLYLMKVDY